MRMEPDVEIVKIKLSCPKCGVELTKDICDNCGQEIDTSEIMIDIQVEEILC